MCVDSSGSGEPRTRMERPTSGRFFHGLTATTMLRVTRDSADCGKAISSTTLALGCPRVVRFTTIFEIFPSGVGACALPFFFPQLAVCFFIHDFLVDIGACRVEAGFLVDGIRFFAYRKFRNAGLKELPILRRIHDIRHSLLGKIYQPICEMECLLDAIAITVEP